MSFITQPGGRHGPVQERENHTQVGGGYVRGRQDQGRRRPTVVQPHLRPHAPSRRPGLGVFRPVVPHVHRGPTHETVIIDHGEPSHSVRVVDARFSKKVASVAALVVGIMLAVIGACLIPVNPISGFALLGVGSGMAFLSDTRLAAIR